MYDEDVIQKIIETYASLGNVIVIESTKLKNKLERNNELDSSDLEALSLLVDTCVGTLEVVRDKLDEIMTSRDNSI